MKFKTIFLSIYTIVFLDFFLTFIAINFFGFFEKTPIHNYFFSLGWYGWIISLCIVTSSIFLFSGFVYGSQQFMSSWPGVWHSISKFVILGIIIAFNIVWSSTIVNNLKLMIKYI